MVCRVPPNPGATGRPSGSGPLTEVPNRAKSPHPGPTLARSAPAHKPARRPNRPQFGTGARPRVKLHGPTHDNQARNGASYGRSPPPTKAAKDAKTQQGQPQTAGEAAQHQSG